MSKIYNHQSSSPNWSGENCHSLRAIQWNIQASKYGERRHQHSKLTKTNDKSNHLQNTTKQIGEKKWNFSKLKLNFKKPTKFYRFYTSIKTTCYRWRIAKLNRTSMQNNQLCHNRNILQLTTSCETNTRTTNTNTLSMWKNLFNKKNSSYEYERPND